MFILDADQLNRFMACQGSRLLPVAPKASHENTEARDEGNAAHWMAQKAFAGVSIASLIDTPAYNNYIMTAEMADHISQYLAALDCGDMEQPTVHGGKGWQVNGRADHIRDNLATDTLTVDDLKYGWSLVDPYMNWTLLSHAIAHCKKTHRTPHEIILRIHQPRPYHPDGPLREWRLSYDELLKYAWELEQAMTNPGDDLVTTIAHCGKCASLGICPAARQAGMNAIDATCIAFADDLPNHVLSRELDLLRTAESVISSRREALEELAAYRITRGAVVPFYAMTNQYANTRWKSGISPDALTAATGINCTKAGHITPAEAKRRGVSSVVIEALTERPQTGIKLTRASADERAQRIFGKVTR